jgi:quercetin dioxygenase-like cupin family protein
MSGTREPQVTSWETERVEVVNDFMRRRMVSGEGMTLAMVSLKAGAKVPQHHHENEQVTWVSKGLLRLRLGANGEQQVDLGPGQVIVIPPNLPHSAEIDVDTEVLDVFCPRREDWISGTDAYLRK